MTKEDKLRQAAIDVYPYANEGNVEDDIDAAKRAIWMAGATSPAAQEYWNGWVRVEDGLPEFGVKVLVFGESKGMNPQMGGAYIVLSQRQDLTGTQLEKAAYRYQDENNFRNMVYVTHWMPLPQPPITDKK